MRTFSDDLDLEGAPRGESDAAARPIMIAAGLLVILMVCAAGFNIWTLRERVERETLASLAKLAMVISEQTSRSLLPIDLALKDIENRISADRIDTADALQSEWAGEAAHRFLIATAQALPQITNLILADADGMLLNTSQSWPTPTMSIADREQFRYQHEHNDVALFVGVPVRSQLDGAWTVFFARRISARDGRFLGIIQAAVKLKDFEEFYRAVTFGEGSSIALIRRDGVMLARFPVAENLVGQVISQRARTAAASADLDAWQGVVDSSRDGVVRYLALKQVSHFPLVVSTGMTMDTVLATWRIDAAILSIGTLGAVIGVLLLLLVLSRKIRRARQSDLLVAKQHLRFVRSRQLLLDAQRVGKFGHWISDATGAHAVWSPQLFEIAGLPPVPDVPLATMLALLHPDDLESFVCARERARELGTTMIHENRWIRPNGEIRWVRMEADPRKDANGVPIGTFGIVQDITERKQAEESAHTSQHLLVDAIESITQGFILYDKNDRFVLANSHYREMFPEMSRLMQPGLTYEQILRSAFEHGLLDQTNPGGLGMDAWVSGAMARHRAADKSQELRCENGRWISLIDHRTSDGGTAGLRTDITDSKTIEATLVQRVADLEQVRMVLEAQKLEQDAISEKLTTAKEAAEAASRAKSDFLAIMSHEIRTPMSGMVGMIDLLRDTPLTDEQQRYATLAKESANGLLEVTNDILDFSKLEAGELRAESIAYDIEHVVGAAASLMTAKAQEKGLKVRTTLVPGLPKWLKGDPNRVRQIILNLVNNAIKFTEGGSVSICASSRELGDGKIELRIEIVDTGIGIPTEVQDRLFNPFMQADTSISRKYGGTGLGLAICKQLCTMMGGTIGVQSAHGQGSTFWFTVQCSLGDASLVAKKVAEPAVAGDLFLQILVAEDSPIIATLISTLLSKRSYSADIVVNGRLALEAVQRKHYDLVLMDVQMPEMDGISATRAIRALPGPERDIPIVALTANAFVGQRETYLAAGMTDYVTKPIQPPALFAAISRCGQPGARSAVQAEPALTA